MDQRDERRDLEGRLDGMLRTGLDFDRHVAETAQAAEPPFVRRRWQRVIGNYRDYSGTVTGTDLP